MLLIGSYILLNPVSFSLSSLSMSLHLFSKDYDFIKVLLLLSWHRSRVQFQRCHPVTPFHLYHFSRLLSSSSTVPWSYLLAIIFYLHGHYFYWNTSLEKRSTGSQDARFLSLSVLTLFLYYFYLMLIMKRNSKEK